MPAKIQIQKQREILLFLIKILSFENFFLFLDLVYYRCSCFILNTRLIMNKDLRKVVILLAHPNMKESQANKALIDAVSDIEGVAVFNLYDQQGASFDVDEWSKIISDASALIYQFPFHWMAAPSLLKKWQDEVFTFLSKTPAVAGKPLTVVTTTGSEYEAETASQWMSFYVLIRLVPFIRGCRGKRLLLFTEWEPQMRERTSLREPTCISNG